MQLLTLLLIVASISYGVNTASTGGAKNVKTAETSGEKAKQKCSEYSQLPKSCSGKEVPFPEVVEAAKPKEFPHMAHLGYKRQNTNNTLWACGGTLISEQFILTSLHCVERLIPQVVVLGDLDRASNDDDAKLQEYVVKQIIKYTGYAKGSFYDDIALLKLDKTVKFDENVRPACLNVNPEMENGKALVSGWGIIEHQAKPTKRLHKVPVEIMSNEKCNKSYNSLNISASFGSGIMPDSQICALSLQRGKDACAGFGGSPLQVYNKECIYTVFGVTSFGIGRCGALNIPGVYTRVYKYLPWIESVVWG